MQHTEIIAEIGSNYDGDIVKAVEYITAVRKCKADAVKFQTLRKDKLVAPRVMVDGKWQENPVYQKFASLELSDEWHHELKKASDEAGIEFISSPFYLEAVGLLEKVGVKTYKVASGDITFFPLLEAVGRTGKRVILSTGASSIKDIEKAVQVLKKSGSSDIVLLHCVSNYPPKWDEMNLKALVTLKEAFGFPVGISDHTPGSLVPIAAVTLGATVIEKHVTFDRTLPGPDHPFAINIEELSDMVSQIRLLEQALGTGEKVPTPAELEKQYRLRRGVYDPKTLEPADNNNGLWLRPQHQK